MLCWSPWVTLLNHHSPANIRLCVQGSLLNRSFQLSIWKGAKGSLDNWLQLVSKLHLKAFWIDEFQKRRLTFWQNVISLFYGQKSYCFIVVWLEKQIWWHIRAVNFNNLRGFFLLVVEMYQNLQNKQNSLQSQIDYFP